MATLTQTQQDLITCLKAFGVEKDGVIAVMLMLRTEDQHRKMLYYLADNRKATAPDIIEQAVMIKRATTKQQKG